jgi:transcriptional regulator with XRE-family HTH domain
MTRSTHYPRYQLFLDALRKARHEAGVTQSQIAGRVGNRQVFVSKLERGDRRMDFVDLYEYCEAAGIDVVAFVRRLKIAFESAPKPRAGKLAINIPLNSKAQKTSKK